MLAKRTAMMASKQVGPNPSPPRDDGDEDDGRQI